MNDFYWMKIRLISQPIWQVYWFFFFLYRCISFSLSHSLSLSFINAVDINLSSLWFWIMMVALNEYSWNKLNDLNYMVIIGCAGTFLLFLLFNHLWILYIFTSTFLCRVCFHIYSAWNRFLCSSFHLSIKMQNQFIGRSYSCSQIICRQIKWKTMFFFS